MNNENILLKINNIKKDCLIGYIEKSLEGEFINLDSYLDELIKFIEEIKNQIPNIESIEEKIKNFQVKYIKRKSVNFLEKKNYKKCINLCDEFILTYACPNYIKREIKYIKLDCLKDISDDLIKDNKREEFMKLIKQISLLKQEIDSELGIKNNSTDLIDIMLKSMNEKAEYFNKNNLYNISENISDLGLQLDPNNINLLTEKSISNSQKGDLNKAIVNNDKILSIESDNLSAKLNKINNISNLGLKDLNKKYIHYLIKIISSTNIINGDSKILVGRSIDVLIQLINKYDNQIYEFFLDKNYENIFPKLKLIEFSFQVKELQYNSSELLKIFYNVFKGKELVTHNYDKMHTNPFAVNYFLFSSYSWHKEIEKEDKYILEIIEKIILNINIVIEVKVNILFLYSKMDPFFISQLKCYTIPINFIEFLFKFRDEYSEFINISLKVLLSLIKIENFELNDSIKGYLFKYIQKNIQNNNLMIDKSDIDEYLRNNKYDESKLEFTMKSIKKKKKKKFHEELINKVFTEDEIDLKLLNHLKTQGIDLESIINNNKKKKKNNIEMIFDIFSNYINSNFNDIKTKDLIYLTKILEFQCDLYIKDRIINLIYEISAKKNFKNEIPMKLLINLSIEIVKLSNLLPDNNNENFTLFLNKESTLLTNKQRINIIIDILFNFIVNKRHAIKKRIDDSIFHNLCFYINNKKVNKVNKDKIIKILKNNEKELKGDIKSVFEIADKTKILERKDSDIEKMISSMADIEEKIKDGFELNINTSKVLNDIIIDNKNNSKIINQTISLINTNVINNQKIDVSLSGKLINMFLDKNVKLDKKVFDNLVICLMNIVKNCKLDEDLTNTLYYNLLNFNKNNVLDKLELVVVSLKILTQKHYSFNKEPILNCLHFLGNENIAKSNPLFKDIEKIIIKAFNNKNLEKEVFNTLFELLNKKIELLDCISLVLLNSLKNKKIKEINILVNWNLKKFENLILNNFINSNMINILLKASFEIFLDYEIIKTFVFFTIKIKELKKENYLEALLILIDENEIKICEYHIKLIEENLNVNGCFLLLNKIIEKDKINLLSKIDVNKIIINLYFDFKNGINLLSKLVISNIHFSDESLLQLSNYLYYNHKEEEKNNIQIKNLLLRITSIQKRTPKIVKDRLEIEHLSFNGKNDENKMLLLRDILSKNKIPKRYYNKIENIINNKYIKHNIKIETITHIFLHSLVEGEIIPNRLWKSFFSLSLSLKELDNLKYILINKNSCEYLKKLFYNKLENILENYFGKHIMDSTHFLLKLTIIIQFKDILNENLQNYIIYLINDSKIREDDLIQIVFWIVKNNLNKNQKTKLDKTLKNSILKKYIKDINVENDFEKSIKNNLYDYLLNKQINIYYIGI